MKKLKFYKDGNVINYKETLRDNCKYDEFENSQATLKKTQVAK